MRNSFLVKSSKKTTSRYQAVDEDQEGISTRSSRTDARDDDVPEVHLENNPPVPIVEQQPKRYDDPRRKVVSPRVKLLLNREFVFQSSKLAFYNSLEMRLASPNAERPNDGSVPRQFLRAPSLTEVSAKDNKEREDVPPADVTDTMSVMSIFYDDHSTANHDTTTTRSGGGRRENQDPARNNEDNDADTHSVGHSIFSGSRGVIRNTRSVESSFPEDPNKWLEAPSVVDDSLFMSATSGSRDFETSEQRNVNNSHDDIVPRNILEEVSCQDQHLWASQDETDTCMGDSVFDKTKHTGRINRSPFDDTTTHDYDEGNGEEQEYNTTMADLFPRDPLWSIRTEVEKQDSNGDTASLYDTGVATPFIVTEDIAFPNDPFFVDQANQEADDGMNTESEFHGIHGCAVPSSSCRDEESRTGHNNYTEKDHEEDEYITELVDKEKSANIENGLLGGNNPFGNIDNDDDLSDRSHDEDGDADDEKSRDDPPFVSNSPFDSFHAPVPESQVKSQATFAGVNPFASNDDDFVAIVGDKTKLEQTIAIGNRINPFESNDNEDDHVEAKQEDAYRNPFDSSDEEEGDLETTQERTFGGLNPFDIIHDEMIDVIGSEDKKTIPSTAKESSLRDNGGRDFDVACSTIFHEEERFRTSDYKSSVAVAKATNLYTMVMAQSDSADVSATNTASFERKAFPNDPFEADSVSSSASPRDHVTMQGDGMENQLNNKEATPQPDRENMIDDIFSQALLPPSTQCPNVDSDDEDCYLEDDDVEAKEDNIEVAETLTYDGEDMSDISWHSRTSFSQRQSGNDVISGEIVVEKVSSNESDVQYLEDYPQDDAYPISHNVALASTESNDEERTAASDDQLDIVHSTNAECDTASNEETTGVHNAEISVAGSDQQTYFDEEANPDSEPLSFEEEEEEGTVGGMTVVGCLHCSALEEELMIIKAQHQTELLERDLQDEDILSNMALMKEYIEHLESDHNMISDQFESHQKILAKTEMEQKLRAFDEELDDRASTFKTFEMTARLKDLEADNIRLLAILRKGEDFKEKPSTEALENRIRELEQERDDRQNNEVKTHEELKTRIQELEKELEQSTGQRENNLKRRIRELEGELDSRDRGETDQDLKHRIRELEEERDLLCTKIEAQEASVALMSKEEEEWKQRVTDLQQQLAEMKLKGEPALGQVLSDLSCTSHESTEEKLIQKLKDELEQTKALCLSQEETICNLVEQVQESLSEKERWHFADVPTEQQALKEDYEAKMKALQVERDNFKAKCIVQQRTITKMQQASGSFLMPPIHEDEEFVSKTTADSDENSDENIYEETDEDVAKLKEKMAETKKMMVANLRKASAESTRFREERDERDARLRYLEEIIKKTTDIETGTHESHEEEEGRAAASWKEKIRRKSHELTSILSKKSRDDDDTKRIDGILC